MHDEPTHFGTVCVGIYCTVPMYVQYMGFQDLPFDGRFFPGPDFHTSSIYDFTNITNMDEHLLCDLCTANICLASVYIADVSNKVRSS
jgi:hypothetical protein